MRNTFEFYENGDVYEMDDFGNYDYAGHHSEEIYDFEEKKIYHMVETREAYIIFLKGTEPTFTRC